MATSKKNKANEAKKQAEAQKAAKKLARTSKAKAVVSQVQKGNKKPVSLIKKSNKKK